MIPHFVEEHEVRKQGVLHEDFDRLDPTLDGLNFVPHRLKNEPRGPSLDWAVINGEDHEAATHILPEETAGGSGKAPDEM